LIERKGRRGPFIGCSGYPECHFMRGMNETNEQALARAKKHLEDNKKGIVRGAFGKINVEASLELEKKMHIKTPDEVKEVEKKMNYKASAENNVVEKKITPKKKK
jgi:ssDNA-binding Zn-finger/Zn-ribbon topoisomerase 1